MTNKVWDEVLDKSYSHSTIQKSSFGSSSSTSWVQHPYKKNVGHVSSTDSPRYPNGRINYKANTLSARTSRILHHPTLVTRTVDNYGALKELIEWPYFSLSVFKTTQSMSNTAKFHYFPKETEHADYECSVKFYNKISGDKINLAVAFAERQQTINLVASHATRIAKAFLALRKGNLKEVASHLGIKKRNISKSTKDLASQWLELQYGWKPLYYDIYGAMIATVPRPVRFPVQYTVKANADFHGVVSSPSAEYSGSWKYSVTMKSLFEVQNEQLSSLAELGMMNPALVAWELTPLSFVFDWWLPVGEWLEAQKALLGLNAVDSNITRTHEWTSKSESIPDFIIPKYTEISTIPGSESRYEKDKTRVLVLPWLRYPRFKNPVSTSHAISALSLLVTNFGNGKKLYR